MGIVETEDGCYALLAYKSAEGRDQAMKKRTREVNAFGRYLDIQALCSYTNVGRSTAKNIATQAGAVIKYGRRVVYDREKIDRFMESLAG